MRKTPSRTVGILAGGGSLPIEIAASLKTRGASVKVIAFEGEADAALANLQPTYVHWGQVGRIINTLKKHGCRSLVIVGSVARPDLGALKPDLGIIKAIPTIVRLVRAGGDDAVLRGVIAYFESNGIKVVSPAQLVPELIVSEGPFGDKAMPDRFANDVAIGFALIRAMARFDIGQSVIVTDGKVEAIEGADGTDAMLNRASSRRRTNTRAASHDVPAGILIKRPKTGQDLRVDLPVIGPGTVMRCVETNLRGITVEAGKVLAVERDELKALANAHAIFVEGVREDPAARTGSAPTSVSNAPYPDPNPPGPEPQTLDDMTLRFKGRVRVSPRSRGDAIMGGQLLGALEAFDQRRIAIVSRGHVLTVEHADHRVEAITRSANLRQWGDTRWRKRLGVAVLSAGRDVDEQVIEAAAKAGLACIAVRLTKFAATVSPPMIALANRHRLAIVEVYPGVGA